MNKKLFLGMFAAAGMLLATSCSNDELDVVQSGNEAQVTFSLAAEGGIATRAIGDVYKRQLSMVQLLVCLKKKMPS